MNLLLSATLNIDWQTIILNLIGGLGIFLYGIYIMGEALKDLAGNRMKAIIEKLTSNPFKGLLVGIIVTIIIQSSSGTTALTIGLVRAGLMSLPQAMGIIMGANIGTTVTAFLIGLKISDYSFLFIGIGALLTFFFNKKMIKDIGLSFLGFGLLFFGMDVMGSGLKDLTKDPWFSNFMLQFSDHPILAVLVGAGLTAVVQSSSATTGIVQKLYASEALKLKGALPMLLGNNIGTTITAVLASIGGSIASKRASVFHVLFNIFGSILFLLILNPYYRLVVEISSWFNANEEMQIAIAHIIFNVTSAIILIWFVPQLEKLIRKMVPGEDQNYTTFNEELFNEALTENSPVLALEASSKALLHMGSTVDHLFNEAYNYLRSADKKSFDEGKELESIVNALDRSIHDYLIKISPTVNEDQTKVLSRHLDTTRDLERIGDHCENILEVSEYIFENKGSFSDEAWEDLNEMFTTVHSMIEKAIKIIETHDLITAEEILKMEESVDRLEKKARKRHTLRVNEGLCTSEANVNFVEILSNLERIGDHCSNIAEYLLNEDYYRVIDEPIFDLKLLKKKQNSNK